MKFGCMQELRRNKVGNFSEAQAITVKEIEENHENMSFFQNRILTIEDILKDNPQIILDNEKIELFLNGVKLKIELPNRNL